MEELKNQLNAWIEEIKNNRSPSWDKLPEVDLYMDQVIVLMEKYLAVFMKDSEDKLITPSMVNNYVKLGLISPPDRKKYSRMHIAYLMTVCILKQILPIPNITDLIKNQAGKMEIDELFDLFGKEQDKAFIGVADYVSENTADVPDDDLEKELNLLALKLTVTADANKLAAERIIYLLKESEKQKEKEKLKEKEKDKDKDKDKDKK